MSDRLTVDVPTMTIAAAKIQQIAGAVGDGSWAHRVDSGMGSPKVEDACVDFGVAWDLAISGLAEAIDGLRDFMSTAVETFEALDDKLSGQDGPRTAR